MSKIGRIALEAQEEVLNPLGYSTVEEAIADGWDSAEWMAAREFEQEKAHEAWEREKEEVIKGLKWVLEGYKFADGDERDIERAIKFIEGVNHE